MKKIFALILALGMLLSLAACGGTSAPDPNAGLYEAKYGEASGIRVPIETMWEKGFSIELKSGGRGVVHVDGNDGNLKWTLEGTRLHIEGVGLSARGLELDGTLRNGVMILQNVMDQGVDLRLECAELIRSSGSSGSIEEDTDPAPTEEPVTAPVSSQWSWWEGKWYGWGVFYLAEGDYADYEDTAWDIVADIKVDGSSGTVSIWDIEDLSEPELDAKVSFASGSGDMGQMICESGTFMGYDFNRNGWTCDPGSRPEGDLEHTMIMHFEFGDDDGNGFTVVYILRPWGMYWDDVQAADTSEMIYEDMMPLQYEDWYLPKVQAGAADWNS